MTREEAIDIIKCLAWHTRPNEEDVEQAIEALEQSGKTCEGCRYENNAGFVEDCHYCNRWGGDRYQKREEMEEDGDDN